MPTFSDVPRKVAYAWLVWALVRVLEAGRVEQLSNGGGWAQGVCRGHSSNREAPKRRAIERSAKTKGKRVCEAARAIDGRAAEA